MREENGGLKGFVVGLAVSSVMSEKTLVPVLDLMWVSVHFSVVTVTAGVCHLRSSHSLHMGKLVETK